MVSGELIRIVRIRRGIAKPSEFSLRPGESGLSLFELGDEPNSAQIIQAVRDAGKQGELAAAAIPVATLLALGLRLVRCVGGTPDPAINAIHCEARLGSWLRFWLWLSRRSRQDYFNATIAARHSEASRILEQSCEVLMMSEVLSHQSTDTREAISALFAQSPPVLVEVRFPQQGTSPDWHLCEDQEELDAILDLLGANTHVYLHSVWDLTNRKGAVCLKR